MKTKNIAAVCLAIIALGALFLGCSPKINVFPDYTEPLQEVTLKGDGDDKILVIPITGVISEQPPRTLFGRKPSVVQEVVSALDLARRDKNVKAVILRIDTPGGTATASDILYREIRRFRADTGVPVVALMMGMATSGGYYTAVASHYIIAHPTTVTGSIGVIFLTVNIEGLFTKIGVHTRPIKSGEYKDIGSPFRSLTEEEQQIFQVMIDELHTQFLSAILKGRETLTLEDVNALADGRIYTAKQALENKLIDEIGYVDAAYDKARALAGIGENARVIVYRRSPYENDNFYNPTTTQGGNAPALVDLGFNRDGFFPHAGFYYVWEPGLSQ